MTKFVCRLLPLNNFFNIDSFLSVFILTVGESTTTRCELYEMQQNAVTAFVEAKVNYFEGLRGVLWNKKSRITFLGRCCSRTLVNRPKLI